MPKTIESATGGVDKSEFVTSEPERSFFLQRGLGRAVVGRDLDRADGICDSTREKSRLRQTIDDARITAGLFIARSKLGLLAKDRGSADTPRKAWLFNSMIADEQPGAWLHRALGFEHDELDKDYIGRLIEGCGEGSPAVGDETFLNFLQWHNHNLAKKQRALDILRDEVANEYLGLVGGADWLPEVARANASARAEGVRLKVDDGYLTRLACRRAAVFKEDDIYTVYIAMNEVKLDEDDKVQYDQELRRALVHEFTHAVLQGEGIRKSKNKAQRMNREDRLRSGNIDPIDEAVTERITMRLLNEKSAGSIYFTQLATLSELVKSGVSEELFIDAYCELRGSNDARDKLAEAIGIDTLQKIYREPDTIVVKPLRATLSTEFPSLPDQ